MINQLKHNNGYLEIIIGPMYAGKTSRIIEIYKKYKLICNIETCVINHSSDDRYNDNTNENISILYTHDKLKIPCKNLDKLFNIYQTMDLDNVKVIIINEGQFFEDLIDFVKEMLKLKKIIYVCGLDGDYQRNKIGFILDLIPLCDKVEKLTAICVLCKDGSNAIFSKRITNETQQIVVGNDNYIPLCRNCFDNYDTIKNNMGNMKYNK